MTGTFEKTLTDSECGRLIFSYIHKNLRNGDAYILYKDQDSTIKIEKEKYLELLPQNTIGIIDNGIYLPI